MGGFGGFTWDAYLDTPVHVLRDSYAAEFDDDYHLVTLRQRRRRFTEDGGKSGSPDRAGRELPTREALNIPAAAWAVNPLLAMNPQGQAYLLMYWSVFKRRQAEGVVTEDGSPITDAYILKRWTEKVRPRE